MYPPLAGSPASAKDVVQLRIQNLSKAYKNGVRALDGIDLTIPSGMFGLLGPNGAGKSTLMRTLATLQEADTGTATIDGVGSGPIDVLKDKDAVRKFLGYLPQEFGLYPKVTALTLLDHLAVLKGIGDRSVRRDTVHRLLTKTNLYDARHRRLGTFSGGMKQRFGIAQALLGDPRLLIVDEPTAGLDPEERLRFLNLLADIGENILILLSTHIVADVADLCQNLAIVDRGKVVVTGATSSLIDALGGRIFRRALGTEELSALEAKYRVVSKRRDSGRLAVRVYSEAPPGEGFEPVAPDLEDVYFLALRGQASAVAP